MTREEAITILNMVEAHGSLVIQAKEMAIKALEYDDAKYHEEHGEVIVDKGLWEDAKKALEQEPCEDCISRQAVLDTLDTADKFLDENRTVERYKTILTDAYEVLPSVKPQEPKTGHWNKDFMCSICGCKCYPMDIDFGDYNYCPNCGAEMKEGD